MLNNNLDGKKILLIGSRGFTADMVNLAHRNGLKIGATDYDYGTYVKGLVDYRHDVSTTDIDGLVELVIKENYNGVISSFSDMLSPYVNKVAQKTGLNFNFTDDQLRLSTDKKYFKEKCIEYGILVPKEYVRSDESNESEIDFPVIVKPTDSAASRGVSICHNKAELNEAIYYAKSTSKSNSCIIEQFIDGDEINLTYIAINGNIQLAAIHDRYFTSNDDEGKVKMPDLYIYPSRYTDLILREYNESIIHMLGLLGIKNGSLFIQACVKNDEVYLYEAGIRLNGCKTYQILEYENDYNTQEQLMIFCVTGSMGGFQHFSPKFKHWYATINVLTEVDKKIKCFKGIDELLSYPWAIALNRLYYEGDTIPRSAEGTLGQRVSTIHVVADSKKELVERIQKVNSLYKVEDENGKNIIISPHDPKEIFESLNYELI